MEKKNSWDDIPSLEGLSVDWEHESSHSSDKRTFVRMKDEDISALFELREILVKIATARETHTGRLLDISEGGLSLRFPVPLEQNQPLKMGFFLGTMKIISKGMVIHVEQMGDQYKVGIRFVDLDNETGKYITGLYSSKVLRHT
jgi:c-di-GMP-binding flagellar brake protein YcgR